MSRIGKLPVQIPSGVQVTVDDKTNTVSVKGKLGELKQKVNPNRSRLPAGLPQNAQREKDRWARQERPEDS